MSVGKTTQHICLLMLFTFFEGHYVLYLHIGTKKTGSTTIQSFLGPERKVLANLYQIEAFGLSHAKELAMASGTEVGKQYWVENPNKRKRMSASEFENFHKVFWQRVEREADKHNGFRGDDVKFVASSEFLFVDYGSQIEALSRLKFHLDHIFGDYKFILYLREQVSFAKSLYAQRVKDHFRIALSFEDFVKTTSNNPRHLAYYIDYADHLKRWVSIFGKDRFIVRTFDRGNFYHGNLIQDFLNTLECDLPADAIDREATKNVSPTFGQINLLRRLNAISKLPFTDRRQKRLRRLITSPIAASITQKKFPTDFDEAIVDFVSSGNSFINENFLDNQVKLPTSL